ncbi:cyclopropane mycolic acid synthase family methyltransferase [Nocardia sp. alder85J]|uniref:cyclopropane mycolic acid synthase family methyltransferase n=1 Tax=Nocardia sp. alder85J TaxID=2862949 RepID=UPI001CD42343|nr:cyclopropane mycolic acid synthase family methyltransferase [Nocardia sp. alder85J]MCX4091104.1 cyclopropane mycolic acid synthase family methyltransferase [Nocardia sp. alder85J]
MTQTPFYADVQSHYDLSDDFFALFLDPTRTYSCAYFEQDDYTLEQAQIAKIDLALGKLHLGPGMTLLDVGCGWGSTMLRALDTNPDLSVIGLTLSRNQHEYVTGLLAQRGYTDRAEVRLQGWEEFDGSVDRIVSIGAFEHFRHERHADFFTFARAALPPQGRMLLHTIVLYPFSYGREMGLKVTRDDIAFFRFIRDVIFPGGQLPFPWKSGFPGVKDFAEGAGFEVERIHALQPHYAKTLDHWSAALSDRRAEAIELCGEATYDTYMRYLTGCAHYFRHGSIDVMQFTCVADDSA